MYNILKFTKLYTVVLFSMAILIIGGCVGGGSSGGGSPNEIPILSNLKSITSFTINNAPGVITGSRISVVLPYGTNIKSLTAAFTTNGKSVTVNGKPQTSGQTANDFTNPVIYVVHAADGTTHNYTVTVTVAANTAKDMYQFALNGYEGVITGTDISVVVPYGTALISLVAEFGTDGEKVTVNDVTQVSGQTTNDFTNPVTYIVHAADGSTKEYKVTATIAPNTAKDMLQFALDGYEGVITGTDISVIVPYGTDIASLIGQFDTDGEKVTVNGVTQVNGETANDFTSPVTYIVHAADGSTKEYKVTVTIASITAKDITHFALDGYEGVITGTDISIVVPYGTDTTSLIARFTTTGSSVKVHDVIQTSGQTANDFTNPVTYIVHAADGSTQDYTVTVTIAPNTAKDITHFAINGDEGVITGTDISVVVPHGTDITSLVAQFTTTGSSVTVNDITQISGQTANNFTNLVIYVVHAADGSTKEYTVTVTVGQNTAKDITHFAINGNEGVIAGTSISVVVPYGTDTTSLIAQFTTTGSSVTVNGVTQVSGQTANDFTSPVIYVVHAADGSTQDYTVTVIVGQNTAKDITQFIINGNAGVITGTSISVVVPYGTDISSLIAQFTTTGSSVTVNDVTQVSGQTANDFENSVIYVVHAADGSTKDYTVTVTIAPNTAKNIYQFILNGDEGVISGTNISVVVPYGTDISSLIAQFITDGSSVTVNGVTQVSGQTANNFTSPVIYEVHAADGSTKDYTVAVTIAPNTAKDITQFAINGNVGVITGTSISVVVPYGTDTKSLIAQFTTTGSSITVNGVTQVSGQTANNFTSPVIYEVRAADNSVKYYLVTVTIGQNTAKDITHFAINGDQGVISGTNISVVVPYGTDLSSLIAQFTTTGSSVTVNGVTQVSGQTANDFAGPVTYVVHAADGSTKDYTVTVTISANTAKDIYQFILAGTEGVITGTNISVVVPYGTDTKSLIAQFITDGSSVTVNGVTQVSGQTANDFTSPVIYVVHAADGSTKDYTVAVTIAPDTAKDITHFAINGDQGVIIGTNIYVTVPYGTDVTALIAQFTTTGRSVTVNGVTQVSGQTANDFTNQVVYEVHAADGNIKYYLVTVTVGQNTGKEISQFALKGHQGVITGTDISVTVPYGTDVTSLIAQFTTTGSSVTVNGVTQVSGQTANDFTSPVIYVVHAADGSTLDYTVTVTISANTAKDITQFALDGYSGVITGTDISVTVPYGTDAASLIAQFITTGSSVTVNGVTQVSGQTANNFTNPVVYVVHAADGSTRDYTVTVTITPQYAYITNYGSNIVTRCIVNANTGTLESCSDSGATNLNGPFGITFAGQKAYIVNNLNNTITICAVNYIDGKFEQCVMNPTNNGFITKTGLNLVNFDSTGKYAYVNYQQLPNSAFKCSVNESNGFLENCNSTGNLNLTSNYLNGMIYLDNYEYIASTEYVYRCAVNSDDSSLSACIPITNSFQFFNAQNITLFTNVQTLQSTAYIVGQSVGSSGINSCAVNPGYFTNCQDAKPSNVNNPSSIAFNGDGKFAYITNPGSNTVTVCSLFPGSPTFDSCQPGNVSGLNNPKTIIVH